MIKTLNLIIPFEASDLEKFACQELEFFLNKVSDAKINVISDGENSLDIPFISIGRTSLFNKDVADDHLKSRVGEDGYRVLIKEDCAYICGGAGQGTIFGVYRFLKELFNLEIFTETVYTFDYKEFYFKPCDIVEKPDIPMRALGIYPVHLEKRDPGNGNKRYCYRMRLRQMDEGWGINNHCYFRVIPPSVYKEKHPDWYDKTGKQLCLTNQEMFDEYVKNMKKIIEDTPDDTLYMFGMEDTLNQCDCPKCRQMMEKYNGFSGLAFIFANRLAKELNAWLKEKHPEREIYFFTFAYVWAIVPPVKKEGDKYIRLFSEIEVEDNLGVLIAPLYTSTNYAWNDSRAMEALTTNYYEKRISVPDIFEGWRAVVKNVAVWSYNHNFADYMAPSPMWNGLEENFRYFHSLNAKHVFMEAGCAEQSNFSEMKIYVCSNLMWNTSLSQDQLIKRFMSVYFKGAEQDVREYFDYIHKHSKWLKENLNREMIFVQFDDQPNGRLMDKRFWPKDMLLKCLDIFGRALSRNLSQDVFDRVGVESLPVLFTLLELHRKELDKDFALKLIDRMTDIANKAKIEWAVNEAPFTFNGYAEQWKKDLLAQ